jgi:hypothetical protein
VLLKSWLLKALRLGSFPLLLMLLVSDKFILGFLLESLLPLMKRLSHRLELLIVLEETGEFGMVVDLHVL